MIERNRAAELLSLVTAPARIIKRRNTAAVDKRVEMHQILDPNVPTMKPFQPVQHVELTKQAPIHTARVLSRRQTVDEMIQLDLDDDFQELLSQPAHVVNVSDQPIDLTMKPKSVPASEIACSGQGENNVWPADTPFNQLPLRYVPRHLMFNRNVESASIGNAVATNASSSSDANKTKHNYNRMLVTNQDAPAN